jgi:hypothetical protein
MKSVTGYLPRLILCVVGDDAFRKAAESILRGNAIEHEWRPKEPRMEHAFRCSVVRVRPSLTDQDFQRINQHTQALYFLSENYGSDKAAETCHKMIQVGAHLLRCGGWAMKCESSAVTHSHERWIQFADLADQGLHESRVPGASDEQLVAARVHFWLACFRAFVQLPIQMEDAYYTCGMHLLGQADLIVGNSILEEAATTPGPHLNAAVELFEALGLYLLAESSEEAFRSGHTFRQNDRSPRFRMEWEHCTGYAADDFLCNPYGRWRFAEIVKRRRT